MRLRWRGWRAAARHLHRWRGPPSRRRYGVCRMRRRRSGGCGRWAASTCSAALPSRAHKHSEAGEPPCTPRIPGTQLGAAWPASLGAPHAGSAWRGWRRSLQARRRSWRGLRPRPRSWTAWRRATGGTGASSSCSCRSTWRRRRCSCTGTEGRGGGSGAGLAPPLRPRLHICACALRAQTAPPLASMCASLAHSLLAASSPPRPPPGHPLNTGSSPTTRRSTC